MKQRSMWYGEEMLLLLLFFFDEPQTEVARKNSQIIVQ
jgi:hypothetical protein